MEKVLVEVFSESMPGCSFGHILCEGYVIESPMGSLIILPNVGGKDWVGMFATQGNKKFSAAKYFCSRVSPTRGDVSGFCLSAELQELLYPYVDSSFDIKPEYRGLRILKLEGRKS